MAAGEIHVGDIGTQFLATVTDSLTNSTINVGGANLLQLIFRRPDGSKVFQTASLLTNGADGKIYYTTQSGDLNMKGIWKLQGFVAMSGDSWNTDIYTFTVSENL